MSAPCPLLHGPSARRLPHEAPGVLPGSTLRKGRTITMVPRVVKDEVTIGHSGSEAGVSTVLAALTGAGGPTW